MMDSYLFESRKAARYQLGAVSVALRNWMLAMVADPPEDIMTRLTIPGVGAIRIGWWKYKDGQKRLRLRFSPTIDVRERIRRHNRAAAASVPGTES